jgi:hypothetical protein
VDREAEGELPEPERQGRVALMREELNDGHECQHLGGFVRISNDTPETWGIDCELCGHTLRQFLLRCSQCHVQMCVRCRRHRI